jgi:hypothetical protein
MLKPLLPFLGGFRRTVALGDQTTVPAGQTLVGTHRTQGRALVDDCVAKHLLKLQVGLDCVEQVYDFEA